MSSAAAPPGKRPRVASAGAESPLQRSGTYDNQGRLPKLPIPPLHETCSRYLSFIEPLQTGDEHEESKRAVEYFMRGPGPRLQKRLEDYAKTRGSYIEDFWEDAYLQPDGSVVLSLNPFFILEDAPTPDRSLRVPRAASLLYSALKCVVAVRNESFAPDVWRGAPLCMVQYGKLFGSSRIPRRGRDLFTNSASARHVVVLVRNQFYTFNVLHESGALGVTPDALVSLLENIVEDADKASEADSAARAVGVLTTQDRKVWAELRLHLRGQSLANRRALQQIDEAILVLCLDEEEPATIEEMALNMLCGSSRVDERSATGVQTGSATNRWYDKLQLVVCKNGVAGVNFEHSMVDGHTVLRFASDLYTDTVLRFAQSISGGVRTFYGAKAVGSGGSSSSGEGATNSHLPTVAQKIKWDLDHRLLQGIFFAETKLSDLICQNEVKVLEFSAYGKNGICKHRMSPDAFVQVALQVAYFTLYGKTVCQYEPVQTKRFYHGRTEAARSATAECARYADMFRRPTVGAGTKVAALHEAIKRQVAVVKACAKGEGVDRHLFALRCIHDLPEEGSTDLTRGGAAKREGHGDSMSSSASPADGGGSSGSGSQADIESEKVPALFADSGWRKLNHTVLSSSNCGNPALRLFGFGPVVADGFGIGYIIKPQCIQFCISSKRRQTQRYCNALRSYLEDVDALLESQEGSAKHALLIHRTEALEDSGKEGDSGYSGYSFFS